MSSVRPAFFYFDLGNVLLPFDTARSRRQMAAVSGIPESLVESVVFQGPLQTAYERGELTTEQFYREFCQRTGSRPAKQALLDASSDMFQREERTIELVRQLRQAGHRVGVLSNTCEAHWQFCADRRYPDLKELFPIRVLSYEVGTMKPDRKIFEAAIRACGISAEQIFFTDDRAENVTGAKRSGLDAFLYETPAGLAEALARRGIVVPRRHLDPA